jgi:DNA invertase Pin-like site-specific DNA recombinase
MNSTLLDNLPHPKISLAHLERLAFIYVRQSTPKQVQHNKESQENQYQLRHRAKALGWSEDRIRVIDSDLGRSGKEAANRIGFQELVAEVSLGHAGIVFGYEVSRLARNNQDWYHLLDLAAVFGTLIADNDGIYDPRLYNDRLLLGLKGTMSEAELHLLRQRLDAGRMSQVTRGTYRQKLPTGYVRLSDGSVEKDPDDQVRHVIELVFAKFQELGSVNKVTRYFRQNQILLPRRQAQGPQVNQIVWKVASESAVTEMLENPAYAGVFAYGRRQGDPRLRKPGQPATGKRRKPMMEWLQCVQNAYPAYITWEQFLANRERIQQNGLWFMEKRQKAQGIVRKGPGLLQGMVVCGHCGHHMQIVYKHTPRYVCRGMVRTTIAPSDCNSVRSPVVDDVVVQAFFDAIRPAQLDALEAILTAQRLERDRLEQQWQEQIKRAQYESRLAQRQYDAVDPQNRLVAAELERRWEVKLQQYRQTEEAYHHFQQAPLPEKIPAALCETFKNVSSQLPELWPQLSNPQKKELLRSLIRQVIIQRPVPDRIEMRIVWVSGCYTDHATLTPIHEERNVSGYDQMVTRIQELCQQGYNDRRIADQLTQEGFHSARSTSVATRTVQKIRLKRGWPLRHTLISGAAEWDGCWTVNGLAIQVGVNESTIYTYIYDKAIPPEVVLHEPNTGIYLFPKDNALLDQLRKRAEAHKRKPKSSNSQTNPRQNLIP